MYDKLYYTLRRGEKKQIQKGSSKIKYLKDRINIFECVYVCFNLVTLKTYLISVLVVEMIEFDI